tara:strand:+ start:285 stop:1247 length:963 start_codon:yes stop_codon:yes gene_type:complete
MNNEAKFFDKELKHYQSKAEWKLANSIISDYMETSATFETSRLDTIRSLGTNLHALFSVELSKQKVLVNAQATLSTLFDKIADCDDETMKSDYYKKLKFRTTHNLIVDTFDSEVSMALENGSASYKAGKKTIKNEWKAGDMIAKQNHIVPNTTDESGNSIPNRIETLQSVSNASIDDYYKIIVGGNPTPKANDLIGRIKKLNQEIILEVLGLKVNLELLELVRKTSDIIDEYINYYDTLDNENEATETTLVHGNTMVSRYNSTDIVLNKVKLPKKFKSKKILGMVKPEAIENNADRKSKLIKDEVNISLETEKEKTAINK